MEAWTLEHFLPEANFFSVLVLDDRTLPRGVRTDCTGAANFLRCLTGIRTALLGVRTDELAENSLDSVLDSMLLR